jgi:hypothetical protein
MAAIAIGRYFMILVDFDGKGTNKLAKYKIKSFFVLYCSHLFVPLLNLLEQYKNLKKLINV